MLFNAGKNIGFEALEVVQLSAFLKGCNYQPYGLSSEIAMAFDSFSFVKDAFQVTFPSHLLHCSVNGKTLICVETLCEHPERQLNEDCSGIRDTRSVCQSNRRKRLSTPLEQGFFEN